jgi:putative ABC transport system ATP-binding protein
VTSSPLVVALDVHRDYALSGAAVHAVRGVSLEITRGEYVAIVGPSGCGKSTLLNLLGAVDRPTRGSIAIAGTVVSALPDREATLFRLTQIGFVFQRFYLLPVLTARENVELPMAEAKLPTRERRDRARELLGYVGLADRSAHRPSELSGGEQQRVAIARAFANSPRILFADEPTGNLDANTGARVFELLESLNREAGSTIVLVTHDSALAARAGRTIRLSDGSIVGDTEAAA